MLIFLAFRWTFQKGYWSGTQKTFIFSDSDHRYRRCTSLEILRLFAHLGPASQSCTITRTFYKEPVSFSLLQSPPSPINPPFLSQSCFPQPCDYSGTSPQNDGDQVLDSLQEPECRLPSMVLGITWCLVQQFMLFLEALGVLRTSCLRVSLAHKKSWHILHN